jgi:hypothetical protein
MHSIDDADEDDHPDLSPRLEVWLAERQVFTAAATLRELEDAGAAIEAVRAAHLSYRTAWLRFMVSLCNLPLADRPGAVEHVMEALREAHLLRPRGRDELPRRGDEPTHPLDVPPEVSHE